MVDRLSIEYKFGTPIETQNSRRGREYRFNCPFCVENRGDPDTKGHLFVNEKYGIYHCYRCGAAGKISSEDSSGYSPEVVASNEELLQSMISVLSEEKEMIDILIPRKKALEDKSARLYLNGRGFTDEVIDLYDLRVGGIYSNLLGYVVIPNQVKLEVMTDMYCARSFVGSKPKYRNPIESRSSLCVYNLHRVEQYPDRMIVCEGAFNAMAAGKDAVALYGKECSEAKLSKFLSKRPKKIIVNLDLDARNKAYELADRIKKRDPSIEVRVLLIDREGVKDAADFLSLGAIDEYNQMVEEAPVYDPIISKLEDIIK